MPRVRRFNRVGLRIHFQRQVDDIAQRYIAGVRTRPASPAQVIAKAVLRAAAQTVIQRFDVHRHPLAIVTALRANAVVKVGEDGVIHCRRKPASTTALYSSCSASATANKNSSSVL
jgi:hypothetical protein